MDLVERILPPFSSSDWEQALLIGQQYLLSCGITGWQDADVQPEQEDAYLRRRRPGRPPRRCRRRPLVERDRGLEQIEELVSRRARMAPRYGATSVKLMLDGIVENYTAALLEPYLDGEGHPTDNLGIDFIDPGHLREIVRRLDRLGFQCHFHALGSRAVRQRA